MTRNILALAASALAACGYTDPGEGSGTLLVTATATYDVGDDDRMRLRVNVSKNGVAVNDALVAVRDDKTGQRFTLASGGAGQYSADASGYRRRLELGVAAGSDGLAAKLEGPGPHVINNPRPGGLQRSSMGDALDVEWATADGIRADEVRININGGIERVLTEDTGSYDEIPMSRLPAGNYELELMRTNQVGLAGGVPGSTFTIRYAVQTSFTLSN